MPKTSEDVVSYEVSQILCNLDGKVSGRIILENISAFCNADDFMLYGLIGSGVLEVISQKNKIKNYSFVINKEKAKNINLLKELIFGRTIVPPLNEQFDLVASFPPKNEFDEIRRIESLYPRLCRLIISSEKNLSLVNPFFDQEGINKIIPFIKKAADRGVKIRIVSRPKYDANPEQEKQLNQMINEIGENCLCKRFGGLIKRKPYHLHAKFMIADDKSAYIGSANITDTSLGNNVEVGVIISGIQAKSLLDFFNLLWNKSTCK